VACLLLAAASSAFAQRISVGIKAGVPLTGLLRSDDVSGLCCLEVATQTRRYTIGPVVDIGLPLGFGVEFGALYKRFDQQSYTLTTTGFTLIDEETSYPIQETAGISAAGHSWEFPVAVQYHFFKSAIRPYVEGGVSLNRLSNASLADQFRPKPGRQRDSPCSAVLAESGNLTGAAPRVKNPPPQAARFRHPQAGGV
jgi:hypothetical protein